VRVRLADVESALRARGLLPRGAFHPGSNDSVPPLPDGRAPQTLILAGNAGAGMWEAFERERDDGRDPLDRWSGERLREVGEAFGAAVLLASDPRHPFQRWARRAEPVHPSPLGILIHPDYGLWHAYRGALALAERLELPKPDRRPSPCDACAERPCLSACPVGAFSRRGFDDAACTGHVSSPPGVDCLERGCLARRACPVGRDHRYGAAQQRFHMEAFLAARRLGGKSIA
jgi:ferredoxin